MEVELDRIFEEKDNCGQLRKYKYTKCHKCFDIKKVRNNIKYKNNIYICGKCWNKINVCKMLLSKPWLHITKETKEKIGNANRNRKVSDETRKKMSLSQIKRWTPELRKERSIKYSKNGNPNFNKRLTEYDREMKRFKPEYLEWKKQVHIKDNSKCKICNSTKNLEAHHLDSYTKFPDRKYIINNGITLCRTDHIEFHKKYGKNTNINQFYEWWNEKLWSFVI